MARYQGGKLVKAGFYFCSTTWNMVTIPRKGGILPGRTEVRYIRVPLLLMLFLGPLLGGLYVVFLPFIGFAMVIAFLLKKAGQTVAWAAYSLLDIAMPHWRPGEAYFTGRGKPREERVETRQEPEVKPERAEPEDRLAALERETALKREKEEK